jgi:hypothetical protein
MPRTVMPGPYRLRLLMVDPTSEKQGRCVLDVHIGSSSHGKIDHVDIFERTGGRNRILSLDYRIDVGPDGLVDVKLNPVKGMALICGAILEPRVDLMEIERGRVMSAANRYLKEKAIVITEYSCPRSEGGRHDYYSEGDYWWPNPDTPDGLPYVHRDGETNPDLFFEHRKALVRLSMHVTTLATAHKITGERGYAEHAVNYLRAFFLHEATKMNPHLLYSQAIPGRVTGRGIGIIDTLHLVEVAKAIIALEQSRAIGSKDLEGLKAWFRAYLDWMTSHKYGLAERDHGNNHSSAWLLQAAAFAELVGDDETLADCRQRFKEVLLPKLMSEDGSFPEELGRTKPYGYSIFHLDVFAGLAQLLSTPQDNLWTYESSTGSSMRKGLEFLYPYLIDKSFWPYRHDIMHWDDWPVRQPCLLFGDLSLGEPGYSELWKTLDSDPTVFEVLRNMPIRQPLLWVNTP